MIARRVLLLGGSSLALTACFDKPCEERNPAQLHTARLSLDTVGEVADTKSPVELVFGTQRMRATGMRANLKSGTLRLESDVNGRFEP